MWFKAASLTALALCVQCHVIQDQRRRPIQHGSALQDILNDENVPIRTMSYAKPRLGKPITHDKRKAWTAICDSEIQGSECKNAIDENANTFWQSDNSVSGTDSQVSHSITIDLREEENVTGLEMIPLRGDDNPGEEGNPFHAEGTVTAHRVFVSLDNKDWNDLVAYGTWYSDTRDEKYAIFQPVKARYIRLEAIGASGRKPYIRIQNLNIWAIDTFTEPETGLGRWGPTINFPLVPVGAFVDPESGRIITFSSYAHDQWSQDNVIHQTYTSTWDLKTGVVSERLVQNTEHDMFCPGMSYDVNGRMILTGGTSARKVSIYHPETDQWVAAPELKVPRGYHGQALTSDGRVFTIGGSWAPRGTPGHRTGEIWDPAKDSNWTRLDGLQAEVIETVSEWPATEVNRSTSYRADNHVWLFGWKNGTVFHAGPKNVTHWIDPAGSGKFVVAGVRKDVNYVDRDSMCGNAVMFDAGSGKILTIGGAPRYDFLAPNGRKSSRDGEPASNNSFIITLDKPNEPVKIKRAGGKGMNFPRIFHNSVVLPNGEVFVSGGMTNGQFFSEITAHSIPEIYSPTKDTWTKMAEHHTVRVYHSVGLLLPDATVMAGGSGLCTACQVNHFDAQIYTPPYLLTNEGKAATRPVIKDVSAKKIWPGDLFMFTTDMNVTDASLVRYGGATHALNNDQRRIALNIKSTGNKNEYEVRLHPDGGVAIPGPWMLFVLNEHGVPSVAKTVYVQIQGTKK